MSQLQRSFMQAKLAQLPAEPPVLAEEEESDTLGSLTSETIIQDSASSSSSSVSSTDTVVPIEGHTGSTSFADSAQYERPSNDEQNSTDEAWSQYFDTELYLPSNSADHNITHHAYVTSPSNDGPLFVMHHGAGSSGLSFAVCASELRKALPNAGVLVFDARGHGQTREHAENATIPIIVDMSLETLSQDLVRVVELAKQNLFWKKMPGLVLVGHSLGGAVVTNVAIQGNLGGDVLAYAVLDVVEGSAMDALKSMHTYLSIRPKQFSSLILAIQWHLKSRTIRNPISARVSVPSLFHRDEQNQWQWRTDLASTQPFWEGWFDGLSKKFLAARGGKLLLLAGTDRLDKELMIGQMQGKYQLQVFPDAGHFIHEDVPEKTARVLVDFYRRNDRSSLVLPPKVSELLKNKQEPGAWTG